MKAITLTQPWASLIAANQKKWETRGWATTYRGPLAIHSAKGYPRDARQFAFQLFFHGFHDGSGFDPTHPILARGFAEALFAAARGSPSAPSRPPWKASSCATAGPSAPRAATPLATT